MLPIGKKPIIISFDDTNYYSTYWEHGLAKKLIVDQNGDFACVCINPEGEEVTLYNEDSVTILENFILKHPDFSFNGAKGVLGFTGYEGILGYKTHQINSEEYEEEKQGALKVVNKLKEKGWVLASHSYYHGKLDEKSYEYVVNDTKKWFREVGILTGPVNVYLFPYGNGVFKGDSKFEYLLNAGFTVQCTVGNNMELNLSGGAIAQCRRHVDGITLRRKTDLETLFDANKVIDKMRH